MQDLLALMGGMVHPAGMAYLDLKASKVNLERWDSMVPTDCRVNKDRWDLPEEKETQDKWDHLEPMDKIVLYQDLRVTVDLQDQMEPMEVPE